MHAICELLSVVSLGNTKVRELIDLVVVGQGYSHWVTSKLENSLTWLSLEALVVLSLGA